MKKVFRTRKFVEDLVKRNRIETLTKYILWKNFNWPKKLEGKTLEEIEAMGYSCDDEWLVEEE